MLGISVIPTVNFQCNLDDIQAFLAERDEAVHFQRLLDKLFDKVIPNLEEFPAMGRDFLLGQPASVEGFQLYKRIRSKARNASIREYIFDQYLILYAIDEGKLYLLSIKHHDQLSFDLTGHWPAGA
ncbi:MAG: type II toxin-antitoxin system RelE/ParE family toxin [Mariprofundaceae bacterium]|nr:type II toxin-antitoxin system RelE/ParE family toxin [Mariprofundaceae bacterium]